jgi:hypothetical protein
MMIDRLPREGRCKGRFQEGLPGNNQEREKPVQSPRPSMTGAGSGCEEVSIPQFSDAGVTLRRYFSYCV